MTAGRLVVRASNKAASGLARIGEQCTANTSSASCPSSHLPHDLWHRDSMCQRVGKHTVPNKSDAAMRLSYVLRPSGLPAVDLALAWMLGEIT